MKSVIIHTVAWVAVCVFSSLAWAQIDYCTGNVDMCLSSGEGYEDDGRGGRDPRFGPGDDNGPGGRRATCRTAGTCSADGWLKKNGDFLRELGEDIADVFVDIGGFFVDIGSGIADLFRGRQPLNRNTKPVALPPNPAIPATGDVPVTSFHPNIVRFNRPGVAEFGAGLDENPYLNQKNNAKALQQITQAGQGKPFDPRLADPVDPITGALTLEVPLFCTKDTRQPFCLKLFYDHQRRSNTSLAGPSWDISFNEVMQAKISSRPLYGRYFFYFHRDEIDYISPTSVLTFKASKNFAEGFNGYHRGINKIQIHPAVARQLPPYANNPQRTIYDLFNLKVPLFLSAAPEANPIPDTLNVQWNEDTIALAIPQYQPIVMQAMDGTQKHFSGAIAPDPDGCGYIVESTGACPYMVMRDPDLREHFNPMGYWIMVAPTPHHRAPFWKLTSAAPSHYLTEINIPHTNSQIIGITRHIEWQGQFAYPGHDSCNQDLECEMAEAIQNSFPRNLGNYRYDIPYPTTMTIRYQLPEGHEIVATARWHIEKVISQSAEQRDVAVFKTVPYLTEIRDHHNRVWKFDYVQLHYPNCLYDWDNYEHPERAVMDEIPAEEHVCRDTWEYDYERVDGTGDMNYDLREVFVTPYYTKPLLLKAIHYPHPQTGAAGGPVKRFDYDVYGRVVDIFNFKGDKTVEVTYDQHNRVATQKLGNHHPITYQVVDNNFEKRLENDIGFEVEITTAKRNRSITAINRKGEIISFKEFFENNPPLTTFYSHGFNTHRPGLGLIKSINQPNGKQTNFSYEEVPDIELRGELSPDDFFKAFRLIEKRVSNVSLPANEQPAQRYGYHYHDNTDYGYDLLSSISNPLGQTISFQYDFETENTCRTKLGKIAKIIHPDQSFESLQYNHFGQILKRRNRWGAQKFYSYYGTGEACD